MNKVEAFVGESVGQIENRINEFIEENNVKIINVSLEMNPNRMFNKFYALLAYEELEGLDELR